jgi:hypothetical protein
VEYADSKSEPAQMSAATSTAVLPESPEAVVRTRIVGSTAQLRIWPLQNEEIRKARVIGSTTAPTA